MTRKPPGRRYRNLVAYNGSIWYERVVGGKRDRFDLETTSWKEAAEARDYYEQRKGIARQRSYIPRREVPTLAEFVPRYLEEATEHLAPSTRRDRVIYLKADAPLLSRLGHLPLDRITPEVLDAWWIEEIVKGPRNARTGERKPRTMQTGIHYMNVLSVILKHAMKPRFGYVDANPVEGLRQQVRENRGKKRREGPKANPVESLEELARLVEAAEAEGPTAYAYLLAHLDAGLRTGEALGLRWADVGWAKAPAFRGRHLHVRRNRPRGGEEDTPKSGRARKVALSLRLRGVLWSLYRERFKPSPTECGCSPPWTRATSASGSGGGSWSGPACPRSA